MNYLILATQTGGILKPFAWILGKILNVIYMALDFIYNLLGLDTRAGIIGFCIILFTLVVRMLMLPMTIKQQKSMKLNAVIQPEIQQIQKKYANKKDQQSQLAQQEEIRAVYDKYGTSMTGGCMQLIIQLPIMFALYRVIMNIPAYVQPVRTLYENVINGLASSGQLGNFFNGANSVSGKMNQFIDAMTGFNRGTGITLTKGVEVSDILAKANEMGISGADKISNINTFFGFNLNQSPSSMMGDAHGDILKIILALSIPILAGLFQFLSVQLSTKLNSAATNEQDNPMAGSMKMMNYMMPLMSVFFCYGFSTGIGIYWVAGSLIMMLQQIFVNMHLKKIDVDEIIESNKEKAAEKAEKRKAKEGIYREKVLEASKVNARNISGSSQMSAAEKEERIRKAKEAMNNNKGSLASKANMVSDYNKRNEK